MAVAWVCSERAYEQIGAIRWEVTWWELRPDHVIPEGEEWSERDLIEHSTAHRTEAGAMKAARKVVASGRTFFGCASVQKQTVDWYVREDGFAEWESVGDAEEVS